MNKHLVLAGGGHAHMMVLASLGDILGHGHRVTVIQPSPHHYYSGMGPGMLSTHYSPAEIRFHTKQVVERAGGRFLKARVTAIEAAENAVVTDSGERIAYDVLSCNVGSFVPFPAAQGSSKNIFYAKPIERLLEAQQRIIARCDSKSVSIAVVGGGPAAVEIAGNAHHLVRTTGCRNVDIRLFAGHELMADHGSAIRRIIRQNFSRRRITIDESGYVQAVSDGTVTLQDGRQFAADVIFLATGVKPQPLFADSGLPTGADGGLLVNEFLQCVDHANIFGGGDCISFLPAPLDKIGVYAVRQNPVLLHNLKAALNGGEQLHPFRPGGNYLLIFNLGEKQGALQKGPLVWGGKSAFLLKDFIDRKFMKRFQVLER